MAVQPVTLFLSASKGLAAYFPKGLAGFARPEILSKFEPKLYIAASLIFYQRLLCCEQEVFAAYVTRTSIKLADGSTVWLNSGSSLKYPDRFINNERIIYLSGEAYFEVELDASKPFIVSTASVDVIATGTKFNVQTYQNEKEVEVTLITGKLAVSSTGKGNDKLISKLHANQHLA